jgi:UDP-N-acetylmuramyl pentapeptide synthase
MFHALSPLTIPMSKLKEIQRYPALQNPAVAHCHQVWKAAYRRVMRREKSRMVALREASDAYRSALPPLSGIQNIRCFITCVTFAMASGILSEQIARKLLRCAQVAHSLDALQQKSTRSTAE